MIVREFAPAKINLFLHVGDKRSDGFHAVQSLVAFASIGDELNFKMAEGLNLEVTGRYAGSLAGEVDNLVLRAARVLAVEAAVVPAAKIALSKTLPVSSGIGGGSADAAATLRGLERLWKIGLAEAARTKLAASLGSDVPVCLASVPSWMEGRGEQVTPAGALPTMAIVLANPGIAVSTAEIFARLDARHGVSGSKPARWASVQELIAYLNTTANDLEGPSRTVAPAIGDVIDALRGSPNVLLARMSGSGATCFGLFGTEASARSAAERIAAVHPDWWVMPGTLAGAGSG